jgi:hypothetical protein
MGFPRTSWSFCAIVLAIKSVDPAAGNGVIKVMGRLG